MKRSILLLVVIALTSFIPFKPKPKINKEQAKEAYVFLNKVRQNPEMYYKELDFPKELPVTRRALRWNDTLAKAAENKAYDMATRNYYAHVDPYGCGMNYYINKAGYRLNPEWLVDSAANNFESADVGLFHPLLWEGGDNYGVHTIKDMIEDYLVPSKGHRDHLLGIGEWNSSLVDIGIGIATIDTGSDYNICQCAYRNARLVIQKITT